ncbi:MAG: selenide, water dikinase SelD [Candidatus Marinimicrobia bacterium]|nr:selenide, water dikinase SelD [Candidatus Neomarinimicrobiota bacterium]MCF7840429.1 selenide, water dikinase SelD [Candidatus Neomarinimicrobiota bacterium]
MGPGDLDDILCGLNLPQHENLLAGADSHDDAGVYKLRPDLAIIQTLDFFTPIVDDPFVFGQVAAANALSDVYAMGGTPLTAMNIVGFPIESMDKQILQEILLGGLSKIEEAGALLVGGHSIKDDEVKYGLSVTGTVHPDGLKTNKGARAGDRLILTKPLGTGIIATAVKQKIATARETDQMIESMIMLNRKASEIAVEFDCHALTDVTGFGLAGHALEICDASEVSLELTRQELPLLPGAVEYAERGILPGGTKTNRKFYQFRVILTTKPEIAENWLLFDPQTSGGLLISLPEEKAATCLSALQNAGITAAMIGTFTPLTGKCPEIRVL